MDWKRTVLVGIPVIIIGGYFLKVGWWDARHTRTEPEERQPHDPKPPTNVVVTLVSGQPSFTWVAPTQDESNAALDATGPRSLKEHRIDCDPASVTNGLTKGVAAMPALTYQAPPGTFSAGAHTCAVQAKLVNRDGSWESNIVSFTVPVAPDQP